MKLLFETGSILELPIIYMGTLPVADLRLGKVRTTMNDTLEVAVRLRVGGATGVRPKAPRTLDSQDTGARM